MLLSLSPSSDKYPGEVVGESIGVYGEAASNVFGGGCVCVDDVFSPALISVCWISINNGGSSIGWLRGTNIGGRLSVKWIKTTNWSQVDRQWVLNNA